MTLPPDVSSTCSFTPSSRDSSAVAACGMPAALGVELGPEVPRAEDEPSGTLAPEPPVDPSEPASDAGGALTSTWMEAAPSVYCRSEAPTVMVADPTPFAVITSVDPLRYAEATPLLLDEA